MEHWKLHAPDTSRAEEGKDQVAGFFLAIRSTMTPQHIERRTRSNGDAVKIVCNDAIPELSTCVASGPRNSVAHNVIHPSSTVDGVRFT